MRWIMPGAITVMIVLFRLSPGAQQTPPPDVSHLAIPGGAAAVHPALVGASGDVDVWIGLMDPPVGRATGRSAKRGGGLLTPGQQRDHARLLGAKQDALLAEVRRRGGRELARVHKAHNAVAVRIDAAQLQALSALPGVVTIRPVRHYRRDLSETVPYIGASAVQATGIDGTGVRVAVLDTGVDYTHRNLRGGGHVADYVAAYGTSTSDPRNTTLDGLFPTAKVVDGFDFIGEQWPNGPRAEDPDPIDFDGHGTHVADIIAGESLDGRHKGVAPGATLLALKVCSSVSVSCNGLALLEAMDFAMDPNGDGDLSDAADVINMSLGSDYGQDQDDLSEASQIATDFGIVVVAAAGNAGDKPYIVSSPSTAPGVISVAQTQVPSAAAIPLVINAPASIAAAYANTATLDFAPITSDVTGDVTFVGRGCPDGSIAPGSPADPYLANPAGKIALIDRGACNVSLKVDRAAEAGAIAVLIGLVAPGDAVPFAFSGGTHFVPSLVITQATSNLIKANLAAPVNATLKKSASIPLVTSMVDSSARGPSYSRNAIKPDIAAPGASVSAQVGTGNGETAFGGTSGATPMISGAAALLVQAHPDREPFEIKSILMNTAATGIFINPATQPGALAPITRIGGGEVRVDRALASTTTAWDTAAKTGALSFGYAAITEPQTLTGRVIVRNYQNKHRTYRITPTFRFASDAATGAVAVLVPGTVDVPPDGRKAFTVRIQIDPSKLPAWTLNGGSEGGNGARLTTFEFDGYLNIADDTDNVHVAWQVLPHKAAAVAPRPPGKVKLGKDGVGDLELRNRGVLDGRFDVFALTGTSPKIHKNDLPRPGDNFAVIDLAAVGVRAVAVGGLPAVQFGITTFGERSHPNYPAEFDVLLDVNRDGDPDYVISNGENGGFGASGENVVSVRNLKTNAAVTRFFADADLDSANMIFTALLSDLGLTTNTTFDFQVLVGDNYFTGLTTDQTEVMTYTLDTPRFVALGVPGAGVPAGGSTVLAVQEVEGGAQASPSQIGLLILYRDAAPKKAADTIAIR
jgi:minor extracellular serine protease Vpr